MPTYTTNFNLAKPLVNDPTDQDLWGGYLNGDLDTLDTQLKYARDTTIRSVSTTPVSTSSSDRNKLILVDATSGAITINLLAAATAGDGFRLTIKKTDSSANTVTIDGNSSETIDGQTTYVLYSQYEWISIVSDGVNWTIVSASTVPTATVMQQGTCSTAAGTSAKDVVLSGFQLRTGSTILVTFTNRNTVAGALTLNVNSTGAKNIYTEAGEAVSSTSPAYFPSGYKIEFVYDGTNWVYKKRVLRNLLSGTSWARVYSDGWIEQGGTVTTTISPTVSVTVNFPMWFFSTCINATAIYRSTDVAFDIWPQIAAKNTDSLVVMPQGAIAGVTATGDGVDWTAYGY